MSDLLDRTIGAPGAGWNGGAAFADGGCAPMVRGRDLPRSGKERIQIVLIIITYTDGILMPATSVQFTVAAHIMAALGFFHGKEISSSTLAESVNADPSFVRKSLSKLSKSGLIATTRGKSGASTLTRSPAQITLLDVYRASAAPPTFAIHNYPVEKRCPISRNIKGCMSSVLQKAQNTFENTLDGITLADVVGEIRRAS